MPTFNQPAWWRADLPTWITALAAAGALIAAIYAARNAFGLLKIEGQRDRHTVEEIKARQASLIDAWEERLVPETFGSLGVLVVQLVNGSPVSVFDVMVTWWNHEKTQELKGITIPRLKPGSEFINVPESVHKNLIEPISNWPFILTFRDRAGVRWRQDFEGHIEQIPGLAIKP